MRLRHRLLVLIAVLLAAVLGGSFSIVYGNARREILERLDAALDVSLASLRRVEARNFDQLGVLAAWLEADPSFRNVLRTDEATLLDHLDGVQRDLGVDLLVVTDGRGRVRIRTDDPDQRGQHLGRVSRVLEEGRAASAYWELETGVYQVASVPLVGARDLIVGSLSAGYRLDEPLARQLAEDTGSAVLFSAGGRLLAATPPAGAPLLAELAKAPEEILHEGTLYRVRVAPLGDVAQAALLQDTTRALSFLERTRNQLLGLGAAALLAALLASLPLVGRMTNPVELLEKAQAEMQAVFRSNIDGLVALDRQGRVVSANPAAAVALGREPEALLGTPLEQLLDSPTALRLLDRGQAEREREGRLFHLSRTAIEGAGDLGSILVTRDVTGDRQVERLKERFLAGVSAGLEEALSAGGLELELAVTNLIQVSRLQFGGLGLELETVAVEPFLGQVAERLGHPLELAVVGSPPPVRIDPGALARVLLNLLVNARRWSPRLCARENGGATEFSVEDEGPGIPEEARAKLLAPEYPKQAGTRMGLGLFVAQAVVEAHHGRLRYAPREGGGSRFFFSLPAAWEPP